MYYNLNVDGGGIFSKYMLCIQNLVSINFDKVYLNTIDTRTNSNIFDSVLKQNLYNDFSNIQIDYIPGYSNYNKIEMSNNLLKYKEIISKFEFREEILNKIKRYQEDLNITKNTIGVHIRLTDMNIHHKDDYGYSTFEDYLKHFSKDYDFFVASDNKESLKKLVDIYGDKIKYIPNFIRGENEKEDTYELQLTNFKNSSFWEEAFIEMFLLSKCGTLICRSSNLSNASIIHSNTINKIIRI